MMLPPAPRPETAVVPPVVVAARTEPAAVIQKAQSEPDPNSPVGSGPLKKFRFRQSSAPSLLAAVVFSALGRLAHSAEGPLRGRAEWTAPFFSFVASTLAAFAVALVPTGLATPVARGWVFLQSGPSAGIRSEGG